MLAFWAAHPALFTRVGFANGRSLYATAKPGSLFYGPYVCMRTGRYAVECTALVGMFVEASVDLRSNDGGIVRAKSLMAIGEMANAPCAVMLECELEQYANDLETRLYTGPETDMRVDAWRVVACDEYAESIPEI